MECAEEEVPACEADEMLVRKADTCCSSYECGMLSMLTSL